jgi:two-component system nitrogen regulation sensor histidine kinase GlnL
MATDSRPTSRGRTRRLEESLTLKNSLLTHIGEITALLTEQPDLDRVFDKILVRVMTGLRFDRAVIMLLSDDGARLECKCIKGFTPEGERLAWANPFYLHRDDCYETRVISTGQPVVLQDTSGDPTETDMDRMINRHHVRQGQERKSLIYVPLKFKGKILGFIGGDRFRTRMEITPDEVEAMVIFANHASIVIENTRLDKERRDKQSLLEGVIKSSINGIIVSDIRGNILHINPKAEEMAGITQAEARGILAQELSDLDEEERQRLYQVFKNKENISHYERVHTRRDGRRLVVSLSCFPVIDENDRTLGVVTEFTDVTEKKRMDDYYVRLEKFAALGHIASAIAHEIRNPLAGIAATVQNLEVDCEEGSPQKTDLRNIIHEVDRLEKLLRDILGLARPLPLQMEELRVRDLLDSTLSLVKKEASKRAIAIRTAFPHPEILIRADAGRLRQVFLNLTLNAMEAIDTKGEIAVTTATQADEKGRPERLVINFRDDGPGIPPGHLNKIFDPFFTTKKVGTGLSLAVCQRIIQDHDGMIEVESRENAGATFRITLPVLAGVVEGRG